MDEKKQEVKKAYKEVYRKVNENLKTIIKLGFLMGLTGIAVILNVIAFAFFALDMNLIEKVICFLSFVFNVMLFSCYSVSLRWEFSRRASLKEEIRLHSIDTTYRLKRGDKCLEEWNEELRDDIKALWQPQSLEDRIIDREGK